jgi:broad specificity phosphatase PhoE
MSLTFVRHGEPARDGTDHDPLDPGLSREGIEQAQATARFLASGDAFDVVYASPMKRAHQTAEIIATQLGIRVQLMTELVEFDYGSQYLHYEDGAAVYAKYRAGDLSPWGTTLTEFRARILKAVAWMVKDQSSRGRALAVCHGGVINAFATYVLGLYKESRVMTPAYGSISQFQRDAREKWCVLELNTTPWPMISESLT